MASMALVLLLKAIFKLNLKDYINVFIMLS